jgi:hypothetical protein
MKGLIKLLKPGSAETINRGKGKRGIVKQADENRRGSVWLKSRR